MLFLTIFFKYLINFTIFTWQQVSNCKYNTDGGEIVMENKIQRANLT